MATSVQTPTGVISPRPRTRARRPERTRKVLREALAFSFLDGAFAVVMFALMQTFAIPAIMALGAAEGGAAYLSGCAALLGGLVQLAAPWLTAVVPSRRWLVVWCVRIQAVACLLFGAAGFLSASVAVAAAVGIYALFGVTGSMAHSPWASWMSDLIPSSIRGRFFATRGVWFGLIHGALVLSIGFLLRQLQRDGAAPWAAFAAVFCIAGACRLVSAHFLTKQYEPEPRETLPVRDFTYRQFLGKVGESNFARFVLALACFHGAAFVAGPFATVYVLRDLGFDYGTLALFSTVSLAGSLGFVRFWGRVGDRFGNRLVLRLCALGIVPIPLVYLVTKQMPALACAYGMGGILWSGMSLAAFNYALEATTERRRVRCFAYMNATIGMAVAAALLAGGRIATHLPTLFEYRLQTVFLLSSLLRVAPACVLAFVVREVAPKQRVRAVDVFNELPAVRPTAMALRFIARPFRRT